MEAVSRPSPMVARALELRGQAEQLAQAIATARAAHVPARPGNKAKIDTFARAEHAARRAARALACLVPLP
jgi:hypothetical protein